MHEKVVGRIDFPADHFRYACTVRHGGYAGIADQRVDLPRGVVDEQVHHLDKEDTAGRGDARKSGGTLR